MQAFQALYERRRLLTSKRTSTAVTSRCWWALALHSSRSVEWSSMCREFCSPPPQARLIHRHATTSLLVQGVRARLKYQSTEALGSRLSFQAGRPMIRPLIFRLCSLRAAGPPLDVKLVSVRSGAAGNACGAGLPADVPSSSPEDRRSAGTWMQGRWPLFGLDLNLM